MGLFFFKRTKQAATDSDKDQDNAYSYSYPYKFGDLIDNENYTAFNNYVDIQNTFSYIPDYGRLPSDVYSNFSLLATPLNAFGCLQDNVVHFLELNHKHLYTELPSNLKKQVYIFAADHGVYEEEITRVPQITSTKMAKLILSDKPKKAAVNVMATKTNAKIHVIDVGLISTAWFKGLYQTGPGHQTRNIVKHEAMRESELFKALEIGYNLGHSLTQQITDVAVIGSLGIGNTIPAITTLIALLFRDLAPNFEAVRDCVEPGFVVEDLALNTHCIHTVLNALKLHKSKFMNAYDILRCVSGFDSVAMTGFIIGAAQRSVPVFVDGLTTLAAAVSATRINPRVRDYIFASYRNSGLLMYHALDYLNLKPFFDLNLRSEDATGALMAVRSLEDGLDFFKQVAPKSDLNSIKIKEFIQ